jgi:hypothetical protein
MLSILVLLLIALIIVSLRNRCSIALLRGRGVGGMPTVLVIALIEVPWRRGPIALLWGWRVVIRVGGRRIRILRAVSS